MRTEYNNDHAGSKRTRNGLLWSLLFSCLLASCEKMLDEAPKSVVVETFYKTAEEFQSALNAIYLPWKGLAKVEMVVRLDTHTDWGYGRGSRSVMNTFSGMPNNDFMQDYWDMTYLSVRNANLVIANAPESPMPQNQIDVFVAEARFLRALNYFDLVRNWGSVPLRTESNMLERDLPKSPVSEIYQLIVGDLLFAETNLPPRQGDVGRPSLYAAKTLLADVYLTLGEHGNARDKAREVIDSKVYDLVKVKTKQDLQWNLFGPEIVTTPEEVFYIKYARQLGLGNWILWVLNHQSTGYFNFGGAYAHYSDNQNIFFKEWDDDDLRKQLWDNIDFGLGATTMVSGKYVDPAAVDGSLGAGNDLPIYRYAETLLIFAEASAAAANGPTVESMEALNRVRRRAYGFEPNVPAAIDYSFGDYDKQSFQDLVLQERAYEFIFEGKRWYDLKRTGTVESAIARARGIKVAEKHYLWPIPNSEFNYNRALDPGKDQNPGY